jgi:hypothetical protein
MNNNYWTWRHTLALFILIAVVIGLGFITQGVEFTKGSAPWTWYANMVALFLFVLIAGQGITGRGLGFLIDSRNKMSLSQLQISIWTIVILATYIAVVLSRVVHPDLGYEQAFKVALPKELWMLLGISLTSMVGSPLILSGKKITTPDVKERGKTVASLATMGGKPKPSEEDEKKSSVGTLMVNEKPQQAQIADLFRGDETGNAAHLDISKVQMFLFTVILVIVYIFGLEAAFAGLISDENAAFPALDSSMITLLGISHAGYLSYKAVPHSKPAS